MLPYIIISLIVLIAYLIGSISSAIIISKLMKLPDPRTAGSGNPGATNVLRTGGKLAGILTLIGDTLKGFLPVFLAVHFHLPDSFVAMMALAVFLGHLYPVFFRFKGGKGVATCLGTLLAIHPLLALTLLGVWIVMFALFRYSSLAALTAVSIGLIYGWAALPAPLYMAFFIMGIFLFWRHRSNIERLLKAQEPKFGKR
jgi:glycerol-3-phosphate acyltransferase PlsY